MNIKKIISGILAVVTAVTAMTTIATVASAKEIYLDNYTVKTIKNEEAFNFEDIEDKQYWARLTVNSDTVVSIIPTNSYWASNYDITVYTLEGKTTAKESIQKFEDKAVSAGVSFKLTQGSYVVQFTGAIRENEAKVNNYTFKWKETTKPTTTVKSLKVYIPLKKGSTVNLSAVAEGADVPITYKSSNTKVATVSSKGVVTGKAAGKVSVTIKAGTKTVKLYFKIS